MIAICLGLFVIAVAGFMAGTIFGACWTLQRIATGDIKITHAKQ